MQGEKSKTNREGSSRLANLNQALMKVSWAPFSLAHLIRTFTQAKQSVAQLSEENVTLKSREQDLVERCENLERQLAKSVVTAPPGASGTREKKEPSTPTRGRPHTCPHPSTPARPVPGETEVESLQIENEKLKKELVCLQTNFGLMSHKSAAVKKEKKELEQSVAELQSELDRILTEKADTEMRLEEMRATLCNKLSSMSTGQQRECDLERELASLKSELEGVVSRDSELQVRLKTEGARLATSEEFVCQLQEKSKSLKEWKVHAESEIGALKARLRELDHEVDKSEAVHSSQRRQESDAVAAYKQKLERVREERRELEGRLREAGQAIDEQQSKASLLEKTNKALKRQLASAADSAKQELREQRESGSSLSREVEELRDRLAAVTEENALLREECDRLEVEQKQTMDQIEGLSRSDREQCIRADSQEGLVRNLQEQIEQQESELDGATEAVRERDAHCVLLTGQLEELQLELSNVQTAKHHLEMEVGELVQKLEELEQSNFELNLKLSDAHNETVLMVATRDEESTRLEELRQKYQDAQTLLLEKESQLSELKYSHKLMESESVNLVSQVSTLSEMVAARNAKIESLQTEALCYESNTRDIVSQIVSLEEEHGSCAQVRCGLEEQLERVGSFAHDAERRERELQDEIASLRTRLRESRENTATLESANRELSQKLQTEAERVEELESSCRRLKTRTQHLERNIQEKENSVTSARGELDFVTKSSNNVQGSLRAEIDMLNARCSELGAKCDKFKEIEVRMKSDILNLQRQLGELEGVNESLRQDRAPLQDRYDETRSSLARVQDDLYQSQKELKSMKAELRYQKRKRAEAEEQLCGGVQGTTDDDTAAAFEQLREELLRVLDEGEENTPSVSRRKIKGILKQSKKHILKPLHNIGD